MRVRWLIAPIAALAVATGDPAAREWAWKRLESAKGSAEAAPVDDADLGDMEPTARRSG